MMRTSWADSIAAENDNGASSTARLTKTADVPPHLRNRQPSSKASEPYPGTAAQAAPPPANDRPAYGGLPGGSRWGGSARPDFGSRGGGYRGGSGYGSGGQGGAAGWNNRGGGWDRGSEKEVNPLGNDDDIDSVQAFAEQENSGINFDAYDDVPVETSGDNVATPVNTFVEIDCFVALFNKHCFVALFDLLTAPAPYLRNTALWPYLRNM